MVLFFTGVLLLVTGHDADVHHTFIPGGTGDVGWMDPWQAYAVSLVSFAVAASALVLAFRKRKGNPRP